MTTQGSEDWHAERLGKVTASRIADVMMNPTTAGYQNYRAQLVCERLTQTPTKAFTSAAMQHGTDTEPRARAMYELETGLEVREVGFVPHPTLEMTGASPDGLVDSPSNPHMDDNGLVEIKCPQPAKHIKNLTGANIDRNYMLQMQWQMVCTERSWCDFVSFCPSLPPEMQIFIQRVQMDLSLCQDIEEAVQDFLKGVDAVTAELTEKYQKEAA